MEMRRLLFTVDPGWTERLKEWVNKHGAEDVAVPMKIQDVLTHIWFTNPQSDPTARFADHHTSANKR